MLALLRSARASSKETQAQGVSERLHFPGKAQLELLPKSCLPHSPGDTVSPNEAGGPTHSPSRVERDKDAYHTQSWCGASLSRSKPRQVQPASGTLRSPSGNGAAGSPWQKALCSFTLQVLQPKQLEARGGARPRGGPVCLGRERSCPAMVRGCLQTAETSPPAPLCCLEAALQAPPQHRRRSAPCCPEHSPQRWSLLMKFLVISKQLSA